MPLRRDCLIVCTIIPNVCPNNQDCRDTQWTQSSWREINQVDLQVNLWSDDTSCDLILFKHIEPFSLSYYCVVIALYSCFFSSSFISSVFPKVGAAALWSVWRMGQGCRKTYLCNLFTSYMCGVALLSLGIHENKTRSRLSVESDLV